MEEDLGSEDDSEIILSSNNPPKEAPPPLPLDLQNPSPDEFDPSETDEETGKPLPRTCGTRPGPSPPRHGPPPPRLEPPPPRCGPSPTRLGPPPPVPPRASRGQAKMKISAHSQSDMRTLLGKHTDHLEEILARQKDLQQDMKRLLELNLEQSQTLRRAMTGDVSQHVKAVVENVMKQEGGGEGLVNTGSKSDVLLGTRFLVLIFTFSLVQSLFIVFIIKCGSS